MRPGGLPDTTDEAINIARDVANTNFNLRRPSHYPDSQIVALSKLVLEFNERVAKLEAKPKRGRPPKSATQATTDLVDRVAETLS